MSDVGPVDVPKTKCECPDCKGHNLKPYAMVLSCPRCGRQHIDEGEFATKLHKVHRCVDRQVAQQISNGETVIEVKMTTLPGCGYEWQPALVYTVGVEAIT